MAPHDEEDDPAVYRSGPSRKSAKAEPSSQKPNGANGSGVSNGNGEENGMHDSDEDAEGESDDEIQADEEEEEEEDGTLLTVQPGFNRLLLVLRDERVMRFVKYVSAAAEGSRWDVCGEYEVGMVEEDDEDDN